MTRGYSILIAAIVLCCQSARAEERLKLDKTTILGNGELPKVTFVVPWRDAPSTIPEMDLSPVAHTVTAPIDRDVYQRHVEYLKQLKQRKRDSGTQ